MVPNPIPDADLVRQHLVNKNALTPVTPKFVVGSNGTASSKLAALPVVKFGDIFVSRFHSQITVSQLKKELFNGMDMSITQMITRHPTYSSFHIRVPAEILADVLQLAFWPEGIIVKRFWGRLLPERIANSSASKNLFFVRVNDSSSSNIVNNELYNCNFPCKSSIKSCLSSPKKPVHFGLYQNCRGLSSKLCTMNRNVVDLDYIFISWSKTWLTDGIFSNELGLLIIKFLDVIDPV